MTFLLFDHIGGIDTLFNTLASGGTVVTVPNRDPETVSRALEKYRVHTLPASPTFLNLWLMSGLFEQIRIFPRLQVIAYGTEPMPAEYAEEAARAVPGGLLGANLRHVRAGRAALALARFGIALDQIHG
ncbi:MAG: AMP-binding protein [Pseudomonadota bacterium]